jgi:hypothetical protein
MSWQPPQYDPAAHRQRLGTAEPGYPYPPLESRPAPQPPRKRRRIYLWIFLAIQVIFLIWVIAGAHTGAGNGAQAHAQALSYCGSGGWQPLYTSYADCVTHYGNALSDAGNAGTAIGVGLVIALWAIADIILGISYGVYRLATRR